MAEMSYRLTSEATEDVIHIYGEGVRLFGVAQTEKYQEEMVLLFRPVFGLNRVDRGFDYAACLTWMGRPSQASFGVLPSSAEWGLSVLQQSIHAPIPRRASVPVSQAWIWTHSYFRDRHNRSTKRLSIQRPLPSIDIPISASRNRPVNWSLVNWLP